VAQPSVAIRIVLAAVCLFPGTAWTQTITHDGFIDYRGVRYPESAPNDPTNFVGDLLVREDVFVKPTPWLQLAAGFDFRVNSHDQVDESFRLFDSDRTIKRPPVALRRLAATLTYRQLTVDVGRQFFRWGKTDIISPTDRFAPHDFLNVIDPELLAVTGVRVLAQLDDRNTIEAVWVPRFTPSRMPLLNQRWFVVPAGFEDVQIIDGGAVFPRRPQGGVRLNHAGAVEVALSYFDGFNHLPNLQRGPAESETLGELPDIPAEVVLTRTYPTMRSVGAEAALPTQWATFKGEVAYFTSDSPNTDEYVLVVVQAERQFAEWTVVGGYAGEVVTVRRAEFDFNPVRGLSRSLLGRAAYNIDASRSVAVEGVVRQDLDGLYLKAEYSRAYGQHWRATAAAVLIRGEQDDFIGQYRRNSHLSLSARYSF
jgi:hypothetical protein